MNVADVENTDLSHGLSENMRELFDAFPAIHVTQFTLLVGQAIFYFQLSPDLTKFIRLFVQSIADAQMFLVLYVMIIFYFTLTCHLLGVKFDDGQQYSDDYSDKYNDYTNIAYGAVTFLSVMRTSIGDL